MAVVDPKELERMKQKTATIQEVAPGVFKGPWLETLYDNRTECWRENIAASERKKLEREGRNVYGQTPEQEKDLQRRKKMAEDKRRKAELAAEMANQNK